jgi:COMPASS component BRE2
MCRANVGVKEGNWFWEARIQTAAGANDGDGSHVRIGWARREGKILIIKAFLLFSYILL